MTKEKEKKRGNLGAIGAAGIFGSLGAITPYLQNNIALKNGAISASGKNRAIISALQGGIGALTGYGLGAGADAALAGDNESSLKYMALGLSPEIGEGIAGIASKPYLDDVRKGNLDLPDTLKNVNRILKEEGNLKKNVVLNPFVGGPGAFETPKDFQLAMGRGLDAPSLEHEMTHLQRFNKGKTLADINRGSSSMLLKLPDEVATDYSAIKRLLKRGENIKPYLTSALKGRGTYAIGALGSILGLTGGAMALSEE
jgi:hypothetical protein